MIVPRGEHSGISDIKFQEEISKQLGFDSDNTEHLSDKQEPQKMDVSPVYEVLTALNMPEKVEDILCPSYHLCLWIQHLKSSLQKTSWKHLNLKQSVTKTLRTKYIP